MSDFNVKEELKKLPNKPGVYIMRDENDCILYVGKAINLNRRVKSYFRENIGRGPKIDRMVGLIDRFEYIITDSELEALVLENNLIKEHRPKYNTMLMDDKTYPYIKVTVCEEYPRIQIVRRTVKDKNKYFGPYTSSQDVNEVVDLLNKVYKLRTCNRLIDGENEQRVCLNYHIGMCSAPCAVKISKEEYNQKVKSALDFLNGNTTLITNELKQKMYEFSEAMEYEQAASMRDLLESVKKISEKQKIEDNELEDKDIIGFAKDKEDGIVQIFFVRNGKMVGREHYHLRLGTEDVEDGEYLSDFITQFYSGTPFIPKQILIGQEPASIQVLEEWLSERKGGRVHLVVPKIGQKEKLAELAQKNAVLLLEQDKDKLKREELRTIGAVREVETWLKLDSAKRMEAFDISNISGFENVGSMVVYESGKPKRSDYRKFKIKTVAGPDDYACMREVLTRRFEHGIEELKGTIGTNSFSSLPDLLLMDGGRGQVNIALSVLEELGLNIPVAGMVKDDNHRTRGLYYNNVEIPIDTHSEGFKLITRIQDEAHRFAIEYHRSLRTKDQTHSVLDDIPMVGPKRRKNLMKAFSSMAELKEASVEELKDKAELPQNVAEAIYNHFHKKE